MPICFRWLWDCLGPFDLDAMASERSVQCNPNGAPLPFYSRFMCPVLPGLPRLQFLGDFTSCHGVDVFSQRWDGVAYIFPPLQDPWDVLQHLKAERLSAVVLVYHEPSGAWPHYEAAATYFGLPPLLVAKAGSAVLRFWHHKTFTRTRDAAAAWLPLPGGTPFDLFAYHLPFGRRTKRTRSISKS